MKRFSPQTAATTMTDDQLREAVAAMLPYVDELHRRETAEVARLEAQLTGMQREMAWAESDGDLHRYSEIMALMSQKS